MRSSSSSTSSSAAAASLLASVLLLTGSAWAHNDDQTSSWSSSHCCTALATAGLQDSLIYPDDATTFDTSVDKYFSLTARLRPQCFFQPRDATEVSRGVVALVEANRTEPCKFAVRSGGHTHFPGAAGIEDGVTMDLGMMKNIAYDAENNEVTVETGAVWGEVYAALDKIGVMVTGGRSSSVGVGGLTIGGGNSFYAARYGFVCDNVAEFEIVLADGSIVTANPTERADLFQALKGGTNNFGIVTQITFHTFEGGDIFGGNVLYPIDTAEQQLRAILNFGEKLRDDPYASAIVISVYDSATRTPFFMNAYEYTKPVARPEAEIFEEFFSIAGNTSDTTGRRNMTSLAHEFEVPKDSRVSFSTLTFKNDIRVFRRAHAAFLTMVDTLAAEATGPFGVFALYQPIPALFSAHSKAKGGNVLGLDRFDETLVMYEPYVKWQDAKDDALIESQVQWLRDDIATYAASIGADNEWLYLNYADKVQKPLEGYGAENVAKIRAAAQKYDPEGVFQYMMPGGFKISQVVDEQQSPHDGMVNCDHSSGAEAGIKMKVGLS